MSAEANPAIFKVLYNKDLDKIRFYKEVLMSVLSLRAVVSAYMVVVFSRRLL
jgi:glucan phosphorylase